MAKIAKGILGPFSGKVHPIVGSTWKNTAYIKVAPQQTEKQKVRTPGQLANQAKFNFFNQWLEPFYPYVTIGFSNFANNVSEINAAFKINYHDALTVVYPNFAIDYGRVCLSKGSLIGLSLTAVTRNGDNSIKVS